MWSCGTKSYSLKKKYYLHKLFVIFLYECLSFLTHLCIWSLIYSVCSPGLKAFGNTSTLCHLLLSSLHLWHLGAVSFPLGFLLVYSACFVLWVLPYFLTQNFLEASMLYHDQVIHFSRKSLFLLTEQTKIYKVCAIRNMLLNYYTYKNSLIWSEGKVPSSFKEKEYLQVDLI